MAGEFIHKSAKELVGNSEKSWRVKNEEKKKRNGVYSLAKRHAEVNGKGLVFFSFFLFFLRLLYHSDGVAADDGIILLVHI